MPSSLFNCVKQADVEMLGKAARQYGKMQKAVMPAAHAAGEALRGHMQMLIKGESSISLFHDVAEHLQVFEDQGNVVVGIPSSPGVWGMASIANQMENHYQITEVATELARQSGDIEEVFYSELAGSLR
jgi:hypothetical protein